MVEHADIAIKVSHFDQRSAINIASKALIDVPVHWVTPARVMLGIDRVFIVGHVGQVRAGHRVGGHRAREVVKHVVRGVGIAEVVHQRRVGRNDVVSLHEGFLAGLPVTRHDLADVGSLVTLRKRQQREVLVKPLQEIGEWCRFPVGIDEDESLPRSNTCLGQVELCRVDLGEVPFARKLLE